MSNPYSTEDIETLAEWNAILDNGCCCVMPSCPVPTKECESIGSALQEMLFTEIDDQSTSNLSDDVVRRYLSQGDTYTLAGSGTTVSYLGGDPMAEETNLETREAAGSGFLGFTYPRSYHGGIGYGEGSDSDGCPTYPLIGPVETCTAEGVASVTLKVREYWGETSTYSESRKTEITIEDAEGDPTEAHAAWLAIYADDAGYADALAIYDTYLSDHAAWVLEEPDFEEGEAAFDAWAAAEPPAVTEPTPEPEEFYGACTFRIVTTYTIRPHYFGYDNDGVSLEDAGAAGTVQEWVDSGFVGDPDKSGSGFKHDYVFSPSSAMASLSILLDTGDGEIVTTTGYTDEVTYADWKTEVEALIATTAVFPLIGCTGVECVADYYFAPEDADDWALNITNVRFRWVLDPQIVYTSDGSDSDSAQDIESFWEGTYFKVIWQNLIEPTAYGAWLILKLAYDAAVLAHAAWVDAGSVGDEPAVPDDPGAAPTPAATLSADQTWEWTGPLDPEDESTYTSPWFSLPAPTENGEGRVVNVRYYCYPSSPYGYKPQTVGEGYEIL